MILYKSDWLTHYPEAIVDTKTRNESFLRLSALYRDMGIENHTFILALHNPELQGLDPFDPNLTLEQCAMIALECKENFWYFIREIARAPGLAGGSPIPLRANRGNIALYWLFFNHILVILIQIRQSGKSFSMDILNRYLLNIRCTGTNIVLITKDDPLRTANLTRIKDIEDVLPYYLRLRTKKDLANAEELTIKSLNNTYKGFIAQQSAKSALNLGRGLTSPIMQFDEGAFLFNIEISLPAALAAGAAARDVARENDEPFGTVITTTAGKKDDRDGRYMFNLVENAAIWNDHFFDVKDPIELEQVVRRSSPIGDLAVNCTFSHRQLGLTDEWLKRTLEESRAKGEAANRDFFNLWTSGSQLTPFSTEISEIMKNSKVDEFYPEISHPHGYVTRWYLKENEIDQRLSSFPHILSVDSSDAAGGDDIALLLRDPRSGEVVAAGNFNETNLISFSEWLCTWFVRFEKLILIIERRSTGAAILDYLLLMLVAKGIDPFKRIYNKVVQEAEEYPDRFKEINKPMFARTPDIYVKYKRMFGFATSAVGATSRSDLYGSTLLNAAKYTGHLIKDPKTVNQILALEIRNGRVDHQIGGHDDNVIAWLLSYWLMSLGKNLYFYDLNSRDILSIKSSKNVISSEEAYNSNEQLTIRKNIEALVEAIKKERDQFIIQKLENQLRMNASKLVLQDNEIFSIDGLMKEIREQNRVERSYTNIGSFSNFYGQQHVGYR